MATAKKVTKKKVSKKKTSLRSKATKAAKLKAAATGAKKKRNRQDYMKSFEDFRYVAKGTVPSAKKAGKKRVVSATKESMRKARANTSKFAKEVSKDQIALHSWTNAIARDYKISYERAAKIMRNVASKAK